MPARIYSGVYGPELVETMGRAFDTAWADFMPKPANLGLARSLMATAIIEAVELGTRDHENLVRRAIAALSTTIEADPEALVQVAPGADHGRRNRPDAARQAQREQ
jgi:hypothetical protein